MNSQNSFSLLYILMFVAFEIRSQCIPLMCNRQAQVTHQNSCPVNIAFLYLLYYKIKIFCRAAQDIISSSIFNHLFYKICTYKETNHFLCYDGGKYYVLKSYLTISFSSYSIQRILDRYYQDSSGSLKQKIDYSIYCTVSCFFILILLRITVLLCLMWFYYG